MDRKHNMLLRNGKQLLPPLCYSCNNFFGNSKWNWRCSVCSYNGVQSSPKRLSPFYTEEYQAKLKTYVDERLMQDGGLQMLKWAIEKNLDIFGIANILSIFIKRDKYITAEFGSTLLRSCGRDYAQKSHLICPFIIDWWNMRNYNFNSMEKCYYGRYGDDPQTIIFDFPPPAPHKSIDSHIYKMFQLIAPHLAESNEFTNTDTTA